ncbi:MAG: Holliday junction resolvase RuvX [Armatimonadota bacterium]
MQRILCLDIGEKRIGLAVSDPLGITAQPIDYILNTGKKNVCERIKELVSEYNIGKIVAGIPYNLKGEKTESTERAEKLLDFLKKNIENVDFDSIDERLSTAQAQNLLIEADVRRNKRKEKIDKLAASLILQNYLSIKQCKSEG